MGGGSYEGRKQVNYYCRGRFKNFRLKAAEYGYEYHN